MTHRLAGRPSAMGPPWASSAPITAAGPPRQQRQDLGDRQVEVGERQGQRGLEAEHAGRRLVERLLLRLGRVRGVVGGDAVDRARRQPARTAATSSSVRSGGLTLNTGSKRRAAASVSVKWCGGRLARDRQALGLGRRHQLDRPPCRQVLEVDPAAGHAGQGDVAHDHDLLGLGAAGRGCRAAPTTRPRASTRPRPAPRPRSAGPASRPRPAGVLERPPHQPGVLHAAAVVGEEPHAEVGQLGHRRQLRARPGRP